MSETVHECLTIKFSPRDRNDKQKELIKVDGSLVMLYYSKDPLVT